MIYFQSLSPWKTDSGRLKQGIEIKRKYENYKIRWRLCQLLMHLKMEKIDASLSEKWFKSLCAGSSLVLSKRFSYQNNWRALYFCDTPVCFGQDVGRIVNVLSKKNCHLSGYIQFAVNAKKQSTVFGCWFRMNQYKFFTEVVALKSQDCTFQYTIGSVQKTERFRTYWRGFFDRFKSQWENFLISLVHVCCGFPLFLDALASLDFKLWVSE